MRIIDASIPKDRPHGRGRELRPSALDHERGPEPAVTGVRWPASSPAVEKFLIVFALISGAVGMGSVSARSAVRNWARRLGIISPSRD